MLLCFGVFVQVVDNHWCGGGSGFGNKSVVAEVVDLTLNKMLLNNIYLLIFLTNLN